MTDISETAYPRIKSEMTAPELARIYRPKPEEFRIARSLAKTHEGRFCALVLLKLAQRLGYFHPLAGVPARVLNHLDKHIPGKRVTEARRREYDRSTQRVRHMARIRMYLSLRVFNDGGEELVREAQCSTLADRRKSFAVKAHLGGGAVAAQTKRWIGVGFSGLATDAV